MDLTQRKWLAGCVVCLSACGANSLGSGTAPDTTNDADTASDTATAADTGPLQDTVSADALAPLDVQADAGTDSSGDASPDALGDAIADAAGPSLLAVDVTAPDLVVEGQARTVKVRAGHAQQGNGAALGSPGIGVTVEVTGGTATPNKGVTDLNGDFSTQINATTGDTAVDLLVAVTVTDGVAPDVLRYFSIPVAVQGLMTTYLPAGTQAREGPVFHGYSSVCDATGNNMYQGVCTQLVSSPVNWAWGSGFSVAWSGWLYAPVAGEYQFSSNYWVDGFVKIDVANTPVANIDTPGGGYSATVSLLADTWVPVTMSFIPNGGSNNMHLGWVPPGAAAWSPVPKANLASPR